MPLLLTCLAGCSVSRSGPAPSAPSIGIDSAQKRGVPEQKHVHRLDFTVTGAGTPSTTTYSMTLAERSTGEIHQGMNVPLAPPGGARVDVGLKIRAFYSMVGDDLLVGCDASVSSEEASGTIRKVTSTGDALVTPGKPTLVASADDPQAKKRYEITVVATRLK